MRRRLDWARSSEIGSRILRPTGVGVAWLSRGSTRTHGKKKLRFRLPLVFLRWQVADIDLKLIPGALAIEERLESGPAIACFNLGQPIGQYRSQQVTKSLKPTSASSLWYASSNSAFHSDGSVSDGPNLQTIRGSALRQKPSRERGENALRRESPLLVVDHEPPALLNLD